MNKKVLNERELGAVVVGFRHALILGGICDVNADSMAEKFMIQLVTPDMLRYMGISVEPLADYVDIPMPDIKH